MNYVAMDVMKIKIKNQLWAKIRYNHFKFVKNQLKN